jgi:hypothetical protein
VFVRRARTSERGKTREIASGTVFFASNGGGALGFSDINTNNKVFRLELDGVEGLAPGKFLEPTEVR